MIKEPHHANEQLSVRVYRVRQIISVALNKITEPGQSAVPAGGRPVRPHPTPYHRPPDAATKADVALICCSFRRIITDTSIFRKRLKNVPVSYTHLTLPTILRV